MPDVKLPDKIKEATCPEPDDVPGVLARLRAIQEVLREEDPRAEEVNDPSGKPEDLDKDLSELKKLHDGLACFNHLYRVITADINNKITEDKTKTEGRFFHNDVFLTEFDVVFAKRYLEAIRNYADNPSADGATPKCWRLLFENRQDRDISRMQFAIHGVTCHVWMDLPAAVVEVCKETGRELDPDTHTDFQKVNEIFHEKIPALRKHFEGNIEREIDRSVVRHFANHLCNYTVIVSRDLAWHHAWGLWKVWDPAENDEFRKKVNHLDNFAAHMGRGVLGHF
jgi:hypothetical protein